MPICKKCNERFPNWIEIEGKQKSLHRRSYCLSCSPYKSNRGQKIKSIKSRNARKLKNCPLCRRNFPWNKNIVCSSCRKKYLRFKQKKKALEILGNKCNNCGTDDFYCLTFHHLVPLEKSIELAASFGSKSWEQIENEISKCCILCYNCHMKEHSRIEFLDKVIDYYENESQ
jgi:hypothetical protein